ncbi:MAG: SDR family NAD(P)-dependent oxidoreductase [Actinomycetota bacterium]
MSGRLEGRVAVITGGGNGIGRACAVRFAEEGANILVADIQDDPGAETVALVKEQGREALFHHVDASSRDDNDAMAQTAVERFGQIDVLVTAAGISHAAYVSGDNESTTRLITEAMENVVSPGETLRNFDLEGWNKVLSVNLTGTMLAISAVGPHMIEKGKGSIITIASIAAKRPEAGPLAYAVSKAGVWMMTKSIAMNLGPLGVRVNAIGPGYINTNMTSFMKTFEGITDLALTQIPLKRMGEPEDVANAALFLASDESSYFTGEILHPDGGFYTE